jgi:hypothetical protein
VLDLPCISCGVTTGLHAISITRRWQNDRRSRTFPARLCGRCAKALIAQAEAARTAPRVVPPWNRRARPRKLACAACHQPFSAFRSDALCCSNRCSYARRRDHLNERRRERRTAA